MKTDTVKVKHTIGKWNYKPYARDLVLFSESWGGIDIAFVTPQDQEAQEGNAELIVAAVNACKDINPDNPLNVAKAIPELLEALKAALPILRKHSPVFNLITKVELAIKNATT